MFRTYIKLLLIFILFTFPNLSFSSNHQFFFNLSLSSDYRARGLSQNNKDPALQGGIDYINFPSGLFAGILISQVDDSVTGYNEANTETDWYLGWAQQWKKTTVKLFATYYYYFDTLNKDNNTSEYFLELKQEFENFSVEARASHSEDWYGFGDANYYVAQLNLSLPYQMDLSASYGKSEFAFPFLVDYEDYEIKLSKTISAVDLSLAYIDTDMSDSQCFKPFYCDETLVLTITKNW
ncbi:MAG: TorF family putative porin [gamma proteobacterium symbiont of Taylorina sp.]|nr:TorF family putative porin [gamma proteobacterium symbiont of Taylorina sp.]